MLLILIKASIGSLPSHNIWVNPAGWELTRASTYADDEASQQTLINLTSQANTFFTSLHTFCHGQSDSKVHWFKSSFIPQTVPFVYWKEHMVAQRHVYVSEYEGCTHCTRYSWMLGNTTLNRRLDWIHCGQHKEGLHDRTHRVEHWMSNLEGDHRLNSPIWSTVHGWGVLTSSASFLISRRYCVIKVWAELFELLRCNRVFALGVPV